MPVPKIIAFDVFGTVFDMRAVAKDGIISYVSQVKSQAAWKPLVLPEAWKNLPAHPDAAAGISRLRQKFIVVTMSNCPLELLVHLSRQNYINWDAIIPIELAHVYKPNPDAYRVLLDLFDVDSKEIMLVTANPTFGDVEASLALKIVPQVIRNPDTPTTIIELAEKLGC